MDTCDCPACNTTNIVEEAFLGMLAQFFWLRCRYCGAEWCITANPDSPLYPS